MTVHEGLVIAIWFAMAKQQEKLSGRASEEWIEQGACPGQVEAFCAGCRGLRLSATVSLVHIHWLCNICHQGLWCSGHIEN